MTFNTVIFLVWCVLVVANECLGWRYRRFIEASNQKNMASNREVVAELQINSALMQQILSTERSAPRDRFISPGGVA